MVEWLSDDPISGFQAEKLELQRKTRELRLEIGVKLEEAQLVLKRLLRLGELGLVVEALTRYQIDTNVFCDH